MLRLGISVAGCALFLVALPIRSAAAATGVTAASYFGSSGDDAITGVAIASDGTIVVAGTTTSTTFGGASARVLGPQTGFVAKLDATATHVLWVSQLGVTGKLKLGPADEPVVATGSTITRLSADGSVVAWTTPPAGAAVTAFDVAPNGNVAVLVARAVSVFAPGGSTPIMTVSDVGRSNPTGIAIDPVSGDTFVSGDNNAGNCNGPWRSPFIFRYDGTGAKTWTFYDYSGAVACGQYSLSADAYFTNLRFDADGTLWTDGGAAGGNSVLSQDPMNLANPSPALAGACFAGACYGWKGAANVGFAARFNAALTTFDRATFVMAHFAHVPAACSCDTTDPGGAARPNSATLGLFATSTGAVVGAGASAWHFPTVDAWYPQAAYTPDYPAVVGIFDGNLTTMTMATILPGTGSTTAADYRGGRLVVAGAAPDNSTWTPPSDQVDLAEATLPATPASAPLQAGYAGGQSDGFLYVACVTTDAECGATPAASGSVDGGSAGGGSTASSGDGGATSGGGSGAGADGGSGAGAGAASGAAGGASSGAKTSSGGCRTAPGGSSGISELVAACLAGAALLGRRRRRARRVRRTWR
jgi:hypothetical protein